MYLYIFEDGCAKVYKETQQDDLNAANDGYLTIYDISNPECAKEYFDGEWSEIEEGEIA